MWQQFYNSLMKKSTGFHVVQHKNFNIHPKSYIISYHTDNWKPKKIIRSGEL